MYPENFDAKMKSSICRYDNAHYFRYSLRIVPLFPFRLDFYPILSHFYPILPKTITDFLPDVQSEAGDETAMFE